MLCVFRYTPMTPRGSSFAYLGGTTVNPEGDHTANSFSRATGILRKSQSAMVGGFLPSSIYLTNTNLTSGTSTSTRGSSRLSGKTRVNRL